MSAEKIETVPNDDIITDKTADLDLYEYIYIEQDNEEIEEIYVDNLNNEISEESMDEKCAIKEIEIESNNDDVDDISYNGNNESECNLCGESLKSQNEYKSHRNKHTAFRMNLLASYDFYRCSRCFMVFLNIESFVEHIASTELCKKRIENNETDTCVDYQYLHDDAREFPIRLYSGFRDKKILECACDLCHSTFKDINEFRDHFIEMHFEEAANNTDYLQSEAIHLCSICGESFRKLTSALHHIYFHQMEYTCPNEDCTQKFNLFSMLYAHMAEEHSMTQDFQCKYCFYAADSNDDLNEHKRKYCLKRNIKCNYCGKVIHENIKKIHEIMK